MIFPAVPHQSRTCPVVTRWLPRLDPRGAGHAGEGRVGEVDVEDHVPLVWFRDGRGAPPQPPTVVQVEGQLAAGDLADRDRPAHVQRVLGAEVLQLGGDRGDGVFEVLGVGEVELAVHLEGAVEGQLALLDGEVPPVRLRQAALPRPRRA